MVPIHAQEPQHNGATDTYRVVDSDHSLERFRASLRSLAPSLPDTRIVLDTDYFGGDTGRLEERLNELYSDCGCGSGTLAVYLAAVGYVIWWFLSGVGIGWGVAAGGVVVIAIAAVAGKVLGLIRARVLLLRLTSSLDSVSKEAGHGVA